MISIEQDLDNYRLGKIESRIDHIIHLKKTFEGVLHDATAQYTKEKEGLLSEMKVHYTFFLILLLGSNQLIFMCSYFVSCLKNIYSA